MNSGKFARLTMRSDYGGQCAAQYQSGAGCWRGEGPYVSSGLHRTALPRKLPVSGGGRFHVRSAGSTGWRVSLRCVYLPVEVSTRGEPKGGGDGGYNLPLCILFHFFLEVLRKKSEKGPTQNKVDEIRGVFILEWGRMVVYQSSAFNY